MDQHMTKLVGVGPDLAVADQVQDECAQEVPQQNMSLNCQRAIAAIPVLSKTIRKPEPSRPARRTLGCGTKQYVAERVT